MEDTITHTYTHTFTTTHSASLAVNTVAHSMLSTNSHTYTHTFTTTHSASLAHSMLTMNSHSRKIRLRRMRLYLCTVISIVLVIKHFLTMHHMGSLHFEVYIIYTCSISMICFDHSDRKNWSTNSGLYTSVSYI